MAAITYSNSFAVDLAHKVHDLETDQLAVALTTNANAPTAADGQLSDITQIAYTNLSSRNITTSTSATITTNDYGLACANLTLTASGGAVATWRWIVVYNDTAANDEIIGFIDAGEDKTLADGSSFTINFSDDNLVELTVT